MLRPDPQLRSASFKTTKAEAVEIQGNVKYNCLRKMVRECKQDKSGAPNRDEANTRSQLLLKPHKGQAGTVREIHVSSPDHLQLRVPITRPVPMPV